ncbi:MAG: hypothetical protein AB7H93_25380 [Vicinamibacterales bacterium]
MSLLDRIRSLFSSPPTIDHPSPGTIMERGDGEFAGPIDEARETAHQHDLGAPNNPITDHVRPPMQ